MTLPGEDRVLYVIVCGAGPAGDVGRLVELAHDRGWAVQIIATPSALAFIDVPKLESQTGRPVRSEYRSPGEPKSPRGRRDHRRPRDVQHNQQVGQRHQTDQDRENRG